MPTHKVKGGYQWGKHGKIYPTKKQADKQGQAIYASGWGESKESKKGVVKLNEQQLNKIIEETINNLLKSYLIKKQ